MSVFPKIRTFGTIGFIAMMWVVDLMGYQYTASQFLVSSVCGFVLGAYAFSLPRCGIKRDEDAGRSFAERMGLDAFGLMKERRMLLFFTFSMLLGVSLQITNGYANLFIKAFESDPSYKDSYFVEHANMLISLSQVSETLCILLIPFFMKRYGIKTVMTLAMSAWVLRFGLFSVGSPAWPGVACLIASMIVYGVAFDFFNISGSLFVDSEIEETKRSSAQGLFILMTNGLGATIGTLAAQAVVNHYVYSETDATIQMEGWRTCWAIFAAYAAIVGVLFAVFFKGGKKATKDNTAAALRED